MNTLESAPEKGPTTPAPEPIALNPGAADTQALVLPGLFSPAQLLEQLSTVRRTQPVAALAAANQHREALTPPFLHALERGVAKPLENFAEEGMLFNYAAYFLAKWREPRAFPWFIQWFSLPGENALELGGDTVLQHGARFLASVWGGEIEPLRTLILNREANPICRGQALAALGVLVIWGERARPEVEDYFLFLAREGLERQSSPLWTVLAGLSISLELTAVYPELRRAIQEGIIPPTSLTLAELDGVEKRPPGISLADFARAYPPITDVIEETRWWAGFQPMQDAGARRTANAPKAGRNDPCPCGSGKKFKKCCGS